MTVLAAELWLADPAAGTVAAWQRLACGPEGVTARPMAPGRTGAPRRAGRGRLALPAPVNAHDHGYGIRTLDFGCADDALEPWICGLQQRPATDPGLEALVAFGRVAQSGAAGTIHCHNSLNAARLEAEAAQVVAAAGTCGIRLGLSCPMLDASPLVYGGLADLAAEVPAADRAWLAARLPARLPPGEQVAAVEAVARAHAGPLVDVQFGPIGPQWASDALLEAIAEASARSNRRVHMHLLESPRQRAWLDRRYPDGIVVHLDAIGLLSPRLNVAHGVQLRPDEWELLADRGVTLVSNPSANLRLRSGILPDACLGRMRCAVGLDGTGFDDAQDIWAELRLFHLLHAGRGLEPSLRPGRVLDAAARIGAAVIGVPAAVDVVRIDWQALCEDAVLPDDDPCGRLMARMSRHHVTDLVVAGRAVLRNRRLQGFDMAAARSELLAQARADAAAMARRRRIARRMAAILRRHYAAV